MVSVEMYTTAACPYCVAAKNLLKQKGFDYSEIRVDTDSARREEMLERSGGRRTVPQIFVNGEYLGDCDGIHALEQAGKLDDRLFGSAAQ